MDIKNLDINAEDINNELATQASKFLFVAEVAVTAEREYDTYKLQLDNLESALDKSIRIKCETEKKKVTEKGIDKEIQRNSDYQSASMTLINKKADLNLKKNLQSAWLMRKDLLLRLAINQRDELDSLMKTKIKVA